MKKKSYGPDLNVTAFVKLFCTISFVDVPSKISRMLRTHEIDMLTIICTYLILALGCIVCFSVRFNRLIDCVVV